MSSWGTGDCLTVFGPSEDSHWTDVDKVQLLYMHRRRVRIEKSRGREREECQHSHSQKPVEESERGERRP